MFSRRRNFVVKRRAEKYLPAGNVSIASDCPMVAPAGIEHAHHKTERLPAACCVDLGKQHEPSRRVVQNSFVARPLCRRARHYPPRMRAGQRSNKIRRAHRRAEGRSERKKQDELGGNGARFRAL